METLQSVAEIYDECRPLFFALGDKIRQRILLALSDIGKPGLNVKEITKRIKLSRPAVSHHLKILLKAGLLRVREDGVQNFYSVSARPSLDKVKRFIDEIEGFLEVRESGKKTVRLSAEPGLLSQPGRKSQKE